MTIRTLTLAALLGLVLMTSAQAQGTTPQPAAPTTQTAPTRRAPTAAQTAQQERMRACNTQAGAQNLRGDARRSFMRGCLGGRSTTEQPAAPAPAATEPRG